MTLHHCFGNLILNDPGLHSLAECRLDAKHRGLCQTALTVPGPLLPIFETRLFDLSNRLIALGHRRDLCAPDYNRVLAWRNRRLSISKVDFIPAFPSVVSAVGGYLADLPLHLQQQFRENLSVVHRGLREACGHNLAGRRIDGQMEFTPSSSFAFTMGAHLPFSFAKDLQACGIDQKMAGAFNDG